MRSARELSHNPRTWEGKLDEFTLIIFKHVINGIMMISRTGIHAIRALASLATLSKEARIGTAILAGLISAPPNYLGKLLQSLARHGLVDSRKGLHGGFRLADRYEVDATATAQASHLGCGGVS